MNLLNRRVSELERSACPAESSRWHRIIVGADEAVTAARSRYETEHGAIGPSDNIIVRQLI